MKRLVLFVVAFSLSFSTGAIADWQPKAERFEKMDSATVRQLFKEGLVMTIKRRSASNLPEVTTAAIIEADPHVVWKAITDYQRRPEMITGVTRVENLKWDGPKATFTQRNVVKFSFIKFAWDENRIHVHTPEKKIIFYEPDRPKEIAGGYELVPLDGGKATLLIYSYQADLRNMGFPVGTLAREMPLVEEILMTSAGIMVVSGAKEYIEKH